MKLIYNNTIDNVISTMYLRIIGGPTIKQIVMNNNVHTISRSSVQQIKDLSNRLVMSIKSKENNEQISSTYNELLRLTKEYSK